ncbi:MAG: ABC transporter substrate-binding protein, partial [Terriglobia bacterium]
SQETCLSLRRALFARESVMARPLRLTTLTPLVLLGLALLSIPAPAAEKAASRTVVDEVGRSVEVPAQVERIITLAPNLTEMIYALGLEERLVGVTNQCDYPPAVRAKPRVGDVVKPNLETIIELQPDLVLGTTAGNRRETVALLEEAGIPLYGVNPHSVEDILRSIRNLAALAGEPAAGEALAARLRARLEAVAARLATPDTPDALFVIWLEPLITAGSDTFLNDVLRRAGARSITARIPQSWPRLSVEEVIERNPDYLVLPDAHDLRERLARLAAVPPWKNLRAVEQQQIIWLNEGVLRPGPRLVDAIEELARALHPDDFELQAAEER